ncbi:MAG: BTAD domain-containing putative transcriptional regulator [Acidimicrobiales bacterium]
MRYRLLGPLEVVGEDDRAVTLAGRRERVLLATLVLGANQTVSTDRLVDALWGDDPPATAANSLQVHVSKLRKKLSAAGARDSLSSAPHGYVLRTGPGEVDVDQFEQLVSAATGDPAQVSTRLREALALWRGPALADVSSDLLQGEKTRLAEFRLLTQERRMEADLALGRHAEVVGELEALVQADPLREGTRRQLMLALYRSGRQADALATYKAGREVLADELGIDPGPELQALEMAILNQDPELAAPANRVISATATPALPSGTLTLLMTDIEGSTRLWEEHPEAMSEALRRHDDLMRAAIEDSGGYVFKTVGDAFCAAFHTAGEARRAVEAAQRALIAEPWPEGASVRVRMALHTGECEERGGDYFGPAVNRVARLTGIAQGGQVLVSQTTADLLRDKLSDHLELRDLGEHRLKDLGRPEHICQLDLEGLPSEFPPLRSIDHPELDNNLPVQLTSFVGREHELAQVRALVDESQLVTLTGPGGSGKTRLALQVAADLLDGSGNGVWFVDLAPLTDPDLVGELVATAVGVREEPGRPVTATLVDALRERHLLVVLDNCEHLVDACAKLTEAILRSCPGVHVIATSREALGIDGERAFRVPSLSLPPVGTSTLDRTEALRFEAVQLFVDRARSHNPTFALDDANAARVVSVCGHLDGIPLAIELAAARLRSLSIADIEDHLGDRFRLLTGGSRGALPRQQTLRALIDWSYELLLSRDRVVFDRLAVFVGGFDLEAAQVVCATEDIESFEVLDAIGSLVDKSLVQADTTKNRVRYRLLETIRQYAGERLNEHPYELGSASARHAEVFLGLAELGASNLHSPQQVEWLARLETEHDNLRAAMAYLLEEPHGPGEAIRLGVALREFWFRKGYHSEGLNLLRDAIERPGAKEPTALRARGLSALAQMYLPSGDIWSARTFVAEGLLIARGVGDPALTAEFLELSAWIDFQEGGYATASRVVDEAVALARQAGEARLIASTLTHRGAITSSIDPDQARADLGEALSISREVGDQQRVINTLDGLALLELERGNVDEGRAHLEECLSICRGLLQSETPNELLHALMNLGLATIMQGDVVNALRLRDESLRLCLDMGDLREVPYNLLGIALCLTVRGETELAMTLHGAADELIEEIGQSFEPLEDTLREQDHSRLRQLVGKKVFESTYAVGRHLASSQAIELAEQAIQRQLAATSRYVRTK